MSDTYVYDFQKEAAHSQAVVALLAHHLLTRAPASHVSPGLHSSSMCGYWTFPWIFLLQHGGRRSRNDTLLVFQLSKSPGVIAKHASWENEFVFSYFVYDLITV